MRFGKATAVLTAAIILGWATAASAQVPNFLNWLIPGQKSQPANGATPNNDGNGQNCSTDQRPSYYFNECGEYIPGQNESPVGG
jgi:hypothetical protein